MRIRTLAAVVSAAVLALPAGAVAAAPAAASYAIVDSGAAAAVSSMMATAEETCGFNAVWAYKRRSICAQANSTMYVIHRPSGAITGGVDYTVRSTVVVNGRSDRWLHSLHFKIHYAWGTASNAASLHGRADCGLDCEHVGFSFNAGPAGLAGIERAGSATFGTPFHGVNAIWHASSAWSWWWSIPGLPDSNEATWRAPEHRCDDTLGSSTRPGCTYESVVPIHQINPGYPKYHRHISLALAHNMTRFLTRTTRGEINDANYARACPASYERPDGHQCDEYPFRSTYNGAASQPYGRKFQILNWNNGLPEFLCYVPLPVRTPGDGGGYSACMIPAGENSQGGIELGLFYYDHRVIDGDVFEVKV